MLSAYLHTKIETSDRLRTILVQLNFQVIARVVCLE